MARRDELTSRRSVDAVVTGPFRGWARDAEVDLFRAGVAEHLHDLPAGGPPDDAVVDHDDALALERGADRVQFQADAEVADALLRLDECPADVVAADEAHLERDLGAFGIADGRRNAGVRHRNDEVRVDG